MIARQAFMFLQKSSILERNVLKIPSPVLSFKCKSTSSSEDRIVITDDGSTIVCWHPPKQFPYECSRSIPVEDIKPQNTILKVENKSQLYDAFKKQSEESTREDLMKLTHTTKHRWFPNNRRFKENYKRIKSDREWL